MNKKVGKQTVFFEDPPSIISSCAIVGQKEGEGPLREYFDKIVDDAMYGEKSWEKAESKFLKEAIQGAIKKSGVPMDNIDYIFAGDLLNQCSGSHFAVRDIPVPFLGIYGACSTMAASLQVGAMCIGGGFGNYAVCATSSHFCSAEKQFRFPLEYGGQRTPSSQWTVTGGSAIVLGKSDKAPYITCMTTGKINDLGVCDANNMGAAMAPAAVDTLITHFNDTHTVPEDYDLIVTGDLGKVGKEITIDLMLRNNIDIASVYEDCGCMIFDMEKQDVHSGGSGCCCSGATLCGKLLSQMNKGVYNKILFVATGALLSTGSCQQGESIPAVAHAVVISNEKEDNV